jgi:DNA polymerase/3'-5' exonuclease PolX
LGFGGVINGKEKEISCKKENFKKHGKTVQYFSGVERYFKNINAYAKNKSIKLEHYIISSGTKEMIEGTSIAKEFFFNNFFAFVFAPLVLGGYTPIEVPPW